MKKKFRITEEQARKIMNLDEATQNQQSSLDPCVHFTAKLAPSVAGLWTPGTIAPGGPVSDFGDIDCCEMLAGNPVGPFGGTAGNAMLQSHCDVGWSQAVLGYGTFAQGNQLQTSLGWAGCCDHENTGGGPCPNGQIPATDPACIECFANPATNSTTLTGLNCMCCKPDDTTTTTSGEDPCELNPKDCWFCKSPGNPCMEFSQTSLAFTNSYSGTKYPTKQDCENNSECVPTPTRGDNGDGCPDVVCKNPNHVQGPYPGCKCECPEGSGEKGCKKPYGNWNPDECCCADKKGNCDPNSFVGPPLQTEHRRLAPVETKDQKELREQMTRIKELLK